MFSKRPIAPYLLPVVALFSQVGCPKCAYPVQVEVFVYPCEYAPCEGGGEPLPPIELEYSFDGGPLLPCDGSACGDDSGGCGSDPNGTYRIVAHAGELSGEVTTVVADYSCISGGTSVEIRVGTPKCPPTVATRLPEAGTLTWNIGDTMGDLTVPAVSNTVRMESAAELSSAEAGEHQSRDHVVVSFAEGTQSWSLELELGDIRTLPPGEYEIVAMRSRLTGICDATGSCTTEGDTQAATLIVEQAQGGPAPWPDIVTNDFYRRYRVAFQSAGLLDSAVSTTCEGCNVDASISLDLTFVRSAEDYELDEDSYCAVE